jgi:DNA-binding phage protein
MSTIVPSADCAPDLAPATQAQFVHILAQWGNVRAAAQQVGVSRQHLYRMRRASQQFREMWDAALLLARPQVEEVLADRALNGVQEVVYYHGEEVATRTRYDSRLLLAHLARLDRLAVTYGVAKAAEEFNTRLEWLARGPIDDDLCDEDYAEEYEEEDDAYGEDEDYAEADADAYADEAGAGDDDADDADAGGAACADNGWGFLLEEAQGGAGG